jgi:deoxyribodipyrimidine photo-lyase
MSEYNIFWFRRDLRLEDNAGLYHALRGGLPVICIFIFDRNILDKLGDKQDARVNFIYDTIKNLKTKVEDLGGMFIVRYGYPEKIWEEVITQFSVRTAYTNQDFEKYALDRDEKVENILAKKSINFLRFKDHVIFDKNEVLKDDGKPYTVFTPYKNKWLKKLETKSEVGTKKNKGSYFFQSYPNEKYFSAFKFSKKDLKDFPRGKWSDIPTLNEMGFSPSEILIPKEEVPQKIIKSYEENRNFPAINGTSKLGVHFRFGTISIREKARKSSSLSSVYLSELVWRDFYSQIIAHFPHISEGQAFRKEYDAIAWRNDEKGFELWCQGKTGYPIVDAGMRELNSTGYMHNRVRMVVASFLTKHLLIDWRWGEAYFASKLLDFDFASNNGGWQWAAGCGTDAAPYFRIFNPSEQLKKFDSNLVYVKKWVPEFGTDKYPAPMVDHVLARNRCLETYKKGLQK